MNFFLKKKWRVWGCRTHHFNFWTLAPVNEVRGSTGLHKSSSLNILESKLISNNNQMSLIFKSLRAHVQIKHHFQWTNNPSQWKLKEDLLLPPAGSCWTAWKEKTWNIMIKNKDLQYTTSRAKCTGNGCQTRLAHLTDKTFPQGVTIAAGTPNRTFWVSPGQRGKRFEFFSWVAKELEEWWGGKAGPPHTEPQKVTWGSATHYRKSFLQTQDRPVPKVCLCFAGFMGCFGIGEVWKSSGLWNHTNQFSFLAVWLLASYSTTLTLSSPFPNNTNLHRVLGITSDDLSAYTELAHNTHPNCSGKWKKKKVLLLKKRKKEKGGLRVQTDTEIGVLWEHLIPSLSIQVEPAACVTRFLLVEWVACPCLPLGPFNLSSSSPLRW